MSHYPGSWRTFAVGCAIAGALVFPLGCADTPPSESGEESTTGALDNQADPDDGKTCYQDVPMRKGKMEMGMCCFDDPVKGTSTCVKCDAEHHCTVGGAEPGALVRGDLGAVVGGVTGVLQPVVTPPTVRPSDAVFKFQAR